MVAGHGSEVEEEGKKQVAIAVGCPSETVSKLTCATRVTIRSAAMLK